MNKEITSVHGLEGGRTMVPECDFQYQSFFWLQQHVRKHHCLKIGAAWLQGCLKRIPV